MTEGRANRLIALDADGVLLDFNAAYRSAWERAFGELPAVRDRDAYWPLDKWAVRRVVGDERDAFRRCFDELFWSTIPALPGALDACQRLVEAGYELVCVSAIETQHQAARLVNLRLCGFPITRVVATAGSGQRSVSPKAAALAELQPVAFVDDFLPYLRGVPPAIHSALVLREPNGSPNVGDDLALAHSTHADLAGFAAWWLAPDERSRDD